MGQLGSFLKGFQQWCHFQVNHGHPLVRTMRCFLALTNLLSLLVKTCLFFCGDFIVAASVEDGVLRFDEEIENFIGALEIFGRTIFTARPTKKFSFTMPNVSEIDVKKSRCAAKYSTTFVSQCEIIFTRPSSVPLLKATSTFLVRNVPAPFRQNSRFIIIFEAVSYSSTRSVRLFTKKNGVD